MDKVSVDQSRIHGPARQIAYRVPHYPADRFAVMLCNLRQEDAACELIRKSGVEVVSLNRGKFDPRAMGDILRLIRTWKPTSLHLHGYAAHSFGRLAGKLAGIPVIVQEHFVDTRLPRYQKLADFLFCRMQHKGLAVTSPVKVFMSEDRYMPADCIEVLANGIPAAKAQTPDPETVSALRESLGIPPDSPVIGLVGRLAEMKGHGHLVEAAQCLLPNFPSLRVVIVGEGPQRDPLREQIARAGLDAAFLFAGYQENVAPYLGLMDVSVVASTHNEGFNTVGIESFGAGTPLVITDLECFQDIYHNGENCLMVPAGDSRALAEAIARILRDPSLAQALAAGGKDSLERYSMERIAQRYMQVYEELTGAA